MITEKEAFVEDIKRRNSKETIDAFLNKQKYVKGNEQDINVNYDFTNDKPTNFVGFEKLQDILLKMNWDDYHLKAINFYNVALTACDYCIGNSYQRHDIKQRFDIYLTIRNDKRAEPTRFISMWIWHACGQKYTFCKHKTWEYNNKTEYQEAIKTALAKIEDILTSKKIKDI